MDFTRSDAQTRLVRCGAGRKEIVTRFFSAVADAAAGSNQFPKICPSYTWGIQGGQNFFLNGFF